MAFVTITKTNQILHVGGRSGGLSRGSPLLTTMMESASMSEIILTVPVNRTSMIFALISAFLHLCKLVKI